MRHRHTDTGRSGELAAVGHLIRRGYRIVERNYRTREGEIDIVAVHGSTLVFCEVKTLAKRDGAARGPASPLEGVRPAKRVQVRKIARAWLADRRGRAAGYQDLRFDAIGVLVSVRGDVLRIDHIEAGF